MRVMLLDELHTHVNNCKLSSLRKDYFLHSCKYWRSDIKHQMHYISFVNYLIIQICALKISDLLPAVCYFCMTKYLY